MGVIFGPRKRGQQAVGLLRQQGIDGGPLLGIDRGEELAVMRLFLGRKDGADGAFGRGRAVPARDEIAALRRRRRGQGKSAEHGCP